MIRLATRQVHLDFHTSECIPDVGARFSKDNFQAALRRGRLNSITIFAKCHHGWCYYPTCVGSMHPTLGFDLTGAMIGAAHEIGVRAPIYFTIGWSAADAQRHPEWVVRDREGKPLLRGGTADARPDEKMPYVCWTWLCPTGAYAELIYAQTREICARYPVDGFFYDICFGPLCWCRTCTEGMKQAGLDPAREEDARTWHRQKWQQFMMECRKILHASHPDASLFFNGSANIYAPHWHEWNTHFELEDLPTTWGGYDKFPLRAKYFARTGKDYLGMTGKFHTSWGEFGGFKSARALRYECATMLAFGARCSIGDQLHPSGEMDLETYRLIGHAYEYVERIEPWCYDTEETTRLGVILSGQAKSDEGFARMLLEKQLDFDVVRADDDLSRFDVLILPDAVLLDEERAGSLRAFAERGGGILLTGQSGLDPGRTRFLLDVGANYMGAANYENDYLEVGPALNEVWVKSPILCYEAAAQVWPTDGEVLAQLREPYFNRTYAHYCSHRNTPYRLEPARHPAALRKGRIIYLAHPLCRMYYEHGMQLYRDYLVAALGLIYPSPVMRVEMPSAGRAHFVRQPTEKRYILHLLYAPPLLRGIALVLEDMPPLYRVKVELRVPEKVRKVYLAPQGRNISFDQKRGVVRLTVPKVECHQMVVLTYA